MRLFENKFQNGDTRKRSKFLWWPTRCYSDSGYSITVWLESIEVEEEYYSDRWFVKDYILPKND